MYEFTIEDNTRVKEAMVNCIMDAIIMENADCIDTAFRFAFKMYGIDDMDYEYNADIKTALTLHVAPLCKQLVNTGSTFTNANRLTKEIVHDFICNWFRRYGIEVYR